MKNDASQKFFPKNHYRFLAAFFIVGILVLSQLSAFAQKRTISGTIIGEDKLSIPGASIVVKGTTIGTVTNFDGKFTLEIPSTAKTIVVTFVGLAPQEIPIGSVNVYNVTLAENKIKIDEVVVVGYGSQKKESIVGAITQTTNEQLKRSGSVTDLKQALTGQLPGVVTVTSSGEPGGTGRGESATSIYIRGQNTWNGGQPLILVDGVERSMDNLDVNEVENISILKDASATAVFGVKGANGVILITTKRGVIGKPKLSFSYNATAKMLSKLPEKMDSYDALLIRNETIERETALNEPSWTEYVPNEIVNRYKLPQTAEYAAIYPNVDWEKAMFKEIGMSHRATINVQGGSDFVKYFGSLAYLHEGDMFKKYDNYKGYKPNYDFDRFNFRSNLDFKLTKTTNLKVNLSGYYSQKNTNYNNEGSTGNADQWMWAAAYSMPPDVFLPQYADGRWGWSTVTGASRPNPIAVVYNLGIRETHATELNSDFALEQDLDFLIDGLSAKFSLFYDNSILSEGGLYDSTNHIRPNESGSNTPEKMINPDLYTGPNQDPSEYTQNLPTLGTNQFDYNLIPWTIRQEAIAAGNWSSTIPVERRTMYQFQMNYARKFNLHNVSAMGLIKREEYANGSMFKNYREDWVFRTTYDYNSKYLFEMNGAYNGSEQFGPGYRFDFFPSVAVGWYVSNEKFFKIKWVNKLKLRFSSGVVGDDKGSGGRWLYASQLAYGGATKLNQNPGTNSPYTWYKEASIGNPEIRWEKARKDNFGLELGLFNNLISINYDYFTEDRTDILISGSARNLPPYFGATPPSANLGRVKSKGHELEVKLDKRTNNGIHYWASLALAHTTNTVLERADPPLLAAYSKQKGYTINQTRTQIRAGFYNNWDDVYASVPTETNDLGKLPGGYNILDFNSDGVIKSDDSAPYGYSQVPQNTFNTTLGADYKGFSFMVQFYGVDNVSRWVPLQNFSGYTDVVFAHVADYWSKDNQNASSFLPRWKTQGQSIGDYFLYDASYLRLKTAEIAYTFQDKWVKNAGLSALRIFINGNNLIFWSKLPDDRESSSSGGSDSQGTYPTAKRINLGFDLTF